MVGALFGEGKADESAAKPGHKIDRLRRHEFGGERQVAFVFAVFIIDHDDHASQAKLSQGGRYIDKRGIQGAIRHSVLGMSVKRWQLHCLASTVESTKQLRLQCGWAELSGHAPESDTMADKWYPFPGFNDPCLSFALRY